MRRAHNNGGNHQTLEQQSKCIQVRNIITHCDFWGSLVSHLTIRQRAHPPLP